MSVLEEILEWSQDRPSWQRDALRRLLQNGDLTDDDLRDLTEICKSAHGLAEEGFVPLTKEHVPDTRARTAMEIMEIMGSDQDNQLIKCLKVFKKRPFLALRTPILGPKKWF
ncbi:MAG TPA: hypothetical protein PLA74_01605 [Syntrophales bacterium]|nr:hypothetical protein [Syntrophales bacterium]